MIGVKKTIYSVINNDDGRLFKERLLREFDTVAIKEDENLIKIVVGETFDTNEFMFGVNHHDN